MFEELFDPSIRCIGVNREELDFDAGWLLACSVLLDTARMPAAPLVVPALFRGPGFSTSVSLASVAVEVFRRPESREGRM